MGGGGGCNGAQERKQVSARLSVQSYESGYPHSLSRKRVFLPPFGSMGGEGGGGTQLRRRDRQSGTLCLL
jgi:hypothetical protein